MTTFPKYSEYKDSGVEWLGEVPAHWDSVPLWTLYRREKRIGFSDEQLLSVYRDYGVIPKSSRDDNFNKPSDDLSSYQLVVEGDLVINKMKAWQGSVAVSVVKGIVSPAYHVYSKNHKCCDRYLHHLFRSQQYIVGYLSNSKGIRVNQWDLEPQQHSRMPVILPPVAEQEIVAAFLDHETTRIDALIDEQKRLIELLKEKRQAVISHAVTKGLDPDVPMKDSGVEWLGEVPAHWEVKRVKHAVRLSEQGWSPQCENIPVESEKEWGVLKVGCVNHGRFDCQENKKLPDDLTPRHDLTVKAGDVLISRANTRELVGSCAVPTVDYPHLMLSDKLFRLRLHKSAADPLFLAFFMNASQTRKQIELQATGASSSMLNIGQGTVLEMPLPCPPVEEQIKIRDEIVKRTWNLLDMAGEAIELEERLKERRSALISAAVTGKIDVRSWQPEQSTEQPELRMVAEKRVNYS